MVLYLPIELIRRLYLASRIVYLKSKLALMSKELIFSGDIEVVRPGYLHWKQCVNRKPSKL